MQLFIFIQHGHYFPFSICLDFLFYSHLIETSVDCCLVVLVSPSLSFGFLDTVCQSWYHAISPLYFYRGGQSPYMIIVSLVFLLLSPQMIDIFSSSPTFSCFSSSSTSAPSLSPQSSGPSSNSLPLSIFLPRSNCYHIHGHLCPLIWEYQQL